MLVTPFVLDSSQMYQLATAQCNLVVREFFLLFFFTAAAAAATLLWQCVYKTDRDPRATA